MNTYRKNEIISSKLSRKFRYVHLLTHLASYVSLFGAILAEWLVKYHIISSNLSKDDPRNKVEFKKKNNFSIFIKFSLFIFFMKECP